MATCYPDGLRPWVCLLPSQNKSKWFKPRWYYGFKRFTNHYEMGTGCTNLLQRPFQRPLAWGKGGDLLSKLSSIGHPAMSGGRADLKTLQGQIKRDPEGYKEEFLLQWRHYHALLVTHPCHARTWKSPYDKMSLSKWVFKRQGLCRIHDIHSISFSSMGPVWNDAVHCLCFRLRLGHVIDMIPLPVVNLPEIIWWINWKCFSSSCFEVISRQQGLCRKLGWCISIAKINGMRRF